MSAIDSAAAQSILRQAVAPQDVRADGHLTVPRSWGVYEIEPPPGKEATRRFRIGNHPVRQRELEIEFGSAKQVALFVSRELALALERLLNGR